MNTKLLLEVKEAILDEPRKFHMADFFMSDTNSPCGTAACIAGHAMMIHQGQPDLKFGLELCGNYEGPAALALELNRHQLNRLFYSECWPLDLAETYDEAEGDENRPLMAKIAAERIDRFIATNGEE